MKEYFYERSRFKEFQSNTTYHKVLQMNKKEFVEWARVLRKEVTEQWDNNDTPPVIGKNREGIIKSFRKLRKNPCKFIHEDKDDPESLGIVKNFNKDASVVNQFFPTMMKTKISSGKSADGGLSIYDWFALPELEDKFVRVMARSVKRDSMYAWCRSLTTNRDENPFWNGQKPVDFIKDMSKGHIFGGKWKNYDIILSKTTLPSIKKYGKIDEENRTFGNIFYLTAEEVKELHKDGYLNDTHVSNLGKIPDTETSSSGKVTKYYYNIRWYDTTEGLFPKMLQAFRLGFEQPAVNFPALTAKWLYETFTSHIPTEEEPFTIYDSSSGWGGRIIGAMSCRRKVHYVGTDPNPDTFIPELGISRYEYVADFYNTNCIDDYSETFGKFFETPKKSNTYELFQDGSELIHKNPKFQKYKGKLDLSFTSPPYFNREQYSQDENQSFVAYSEYDDWRDNFLRPTLTTIYEYTKSDRYILWNIASIKIGKNTYFELEEDSVKILEELGCEYKGKYKMLMAAMIGVNMNKREEVGSSVKNIVEVNGTWYKYEPIFVFHKK